MTGSHDRRIHADALHKQQRGSSATRFKRQAIAMLVSVAMGGITLPCWMVDHQTIVATATYEWARIKLWAVSAWADDTAVDIHVGDQILEGRSARAVVALPYSQQSARQVWAYATWGSGLGFVGWLGVLLARRGVALRRRERLLADRWMAGTAMTTEKGLAKLTGKEAGTVPLSIGTVPIPARLETRHMAMVGTTGSGKTTALRQLLDGIEARGEAALVYDTSGEFIAHYHRPDRGDIILNPFDARCAFWSPFAEIAHPADADRIAHQLITETGQHDSDVWLDTSRILVANMIRALWREGKCSLADLLHALQNRTKDDLKEWLATSSSARTFADDADRATGSVLFMLAKAADLIQFLRIEDSGGTPFAFRDFIHGLDKRKGARPWIFVPRKEDYFEASKPLLACWLECAASAVLGLPPSPDRRIWFVLDELADLPRVDNLARLLPEGRKFGAAVILTFQALGQMRHRYGPQIAESMLGCCNTKLFLQTIDSETRQWASQTIGECEIEMQTMTDALAEGDDGPRTTLGVTRKMRPAVLESELRLPAFEGFLLFPDGLPVARIKLTADHVARRGAARVAGFLPGDPKNTLWDKASAAAPPSSPAPAPTPSAPASRRQRSKSEAPKGPGPV
ncbi:conjugal transfer protein TraD [Novosphingobium sp. AAP1]|uniref:type IV secretion system DNA-binding domain-containing protein n=1 Tax=Novosphingobium sp. AAP1 TaxID=1523413 RepID=UPI0006B889DA|nr:type IV secretion system DNA-binding domain-containing protein [Novosphingobium sp. AAP1]KPF55366.1 conjugal transfer protein TraD [Novosphingobium sp. AAP1]